MIEIIIGASMFIVQFTVITYLFFTLLLALKYAILRNGWQDKTLARWIFYPNAAWFLIRDVANNFVLIPIFLQWPNSNGEGWTVSAHISFIKAWTEIEIMRRSKSNPGIHLLTRTERWRYTVAMALRELLNRTEQKIGHKDHIR